MGTVSNALVILGIQLLFTDTSGTSLTLTGSANYAVLDQTFRFTCSLTDDSSAEGILTFGKVDQASSCAVIVSTASSNPCTQAGTGTDYTCGCVSGQTSVYYMNISRVSVTQDEATWRCLRLPNYSNNITLPVYYSPQIKSTFPSSKTVTELSRLQIDCSSYTTPGNPPTTSYTWTYGGSTISSGATLDLKNIGRDRRGQYTCIASNTGGFDSETVSVDVQYSPQIKSTFPSSRTVTESTRLQIDCSSYTTPGNPSTTSFTWTYGGSTISSGAILDINNISRDRRGQYTCTASNTGGSESATVSVDVQYLDRPTLTLDKTEVVENETVSLTCNVESNPTAELEIRNVDNNTVLVERDTNRLQFTIDRVQCLHNGSFLCTARNTKIGDMSSSSRTELNVLCKPSINNKQPSSTTLTRGLGDVASFTACVVANPSPRFVWYVKSNEQLLPIPSSTDHTIVSSQLASVLQIHVNNNSDYGTYAVLVTNTIGQLRMTFNVLPLAPDTCSCLQTPDRLGLGVGIGISVMIPVIIVIMSTWLLLHRRQVKSPKKTGNGTSELQSIHNSVAGEQRPYEDLTVTTSTVNEYEQLQVTEGGISKRPTYQHDYVIDTHYYAVLNTYYNTLTLMTVGGATLKNNLESVNRSNFDSLAGFAKKIKYLVCDNPHLQKCIADISANFYFNMCCWYVQILNTVKDDAQVLFQ